MCHFFFLSMSYSPYVLSLVSGYHSKIPCKYLSIYCLPEKLCLNIPISCFILAYVLCLAYYNVFSMLYLSLFSLLIVNFSQFNLPLSVLYQFLLISFLCHASFQLDVLFIHFYRCFYTFMCKCLLLQLTFQQYFNLLF